jgi:gamma-glutamyl:cysteine ligase YbdK (ATP-grasp superfamily)
MGQEIASSRFEQADIERFGARLAHELALLGKLFSEGGFSRRRAVGGLELEAWLVGRDGGPLAINEAFLEHLADPAIVPELAKFNIELNVDPQSLAGNGIRRLEGDLGQAYARCARAGDALGATVVAIGILPTITDEALCPANMSSMRRYAALNEQVIRLRKGRPIRLDIVGHEHLKTEHMDVMLEAAATSFQLHLQVPPDRAARYLNAATILSAPMVAVAANSPILFGRILWEETRIPLFEQAVDVGSPERRVTFGSGYVRASLYECYIENSANHPAILPLALGESAERFPHLRLHNGTIWRWNRPLIGFDPDGTPHLRIEHRVLPAGPTLIDMAANMAFFFGLMEWLVMEPHAPEHRLPHAAAKQNFYQAARLGLAAGVDWYDGERWNAARLVQKVLLEQARKGLEALRVDRGDIDRYLGTIEARVASGATGAAWQREFVAKHGREMRALTCAYRDLSDDGEPVHRWKV